MVATCASNPSSSRLCTGHVARYSRAGTSMLPPCVTVTILGRSASHSALTASRYTRAGSAAAVDAAPLGAVLAGDGPDDEQPASAALSTTAPTSRRVVLSFTLESSHPETAT